MSGVGDSFIVTKKEVLIMSNDNNYDSHPCAVCGDTITSPEPREIHIECGAFRLIADILR
jgi:hypothetical protein